MNIRQTSLVLSLCLAVSFISVISYKLFYLYGSKKDIIRLQDSIEATSILNKAIIELSLERSVMQVTLNLDTPIQPQFRDLINAQRAKSDDGFNKVAQMISDNKALNRSQEFLEAFETLRNDIASIRQAADNSLTRPLAERAVERVEGLPPRMKDTILAFSQLSIKITPKGSQMPTIISTLEKIQQNAWAVREYGGRERTYMAIATATGRNLDAVTLKQMSGYHKKAEEAMAELSLLAGYSLLNSEVTDKINLVNSVYFVSYEQTRQDIKNANALNLPYPISFGDFFTVSSNALNTAVNLSYLAGNEMITLMAEKNQTATTMFWGFLAFLVFVISLCAYQIYYTQMRISKRILRLANSMELLTKGETDIVVSSFTTHDEIAKMAESVEVFRLNAIEVKRLEEEQKLQEERTKAAQREAALKMADEFEARVGDIVNLVQKSSGEMQNMSEKLSDVISEASVKSSSVATASNQTSSNVQTVAAATEEMSASINSISSSVVGAAETAKECASSAHTSQQKLNELRKAVDEIDDVLLSIATVAEQTNLLALNATIEAARAGETGKGFAVVASEVKNLANQTHKMTEEISNKVNDIKGSAQETIDTMSQIIQQISDVDMKTATVASAMEQQNSATTEISESVSQAATGTGEVSQNIENVQMMTSESAKSTDRMKTAANDLNSQVHNLKGTVDGFLAEIREA